MGMGSSGCLIWIFTGNKLWCNNIIWICGRNKRWEVGILIYVNLFFCNWRTNEAASRRGPFGAPFVLQENLRVSGNILLMFQLNSQPGTLLLNLPCGKLAFRLLWRIQGYFPFCERGSSLTLVIALRLSLGSYAWKLWFTKRFLTASSHKTEASRCQVRVEYLCKWNHGFWQLLKIEYFIICSWFTDLQYFVTSKKPKTSVNYALRTKIM